VPLEKQNSSINRPVPSMGAAIKLVIEIMNCVGAGGITPQSLLGFSIKHPHLQTSAVHPCLWAALSGQIMSLSVLSVSKNGVTLSTLIAAALPFFIATPLAAQTVAAAQGSSVGESPSGEAPKKDLEITLGAGVGVAPDYYGSKKTEFDFVPVIDIVYKNRFFFGTQGLGIYAVNDEESGITVGAAIAPGNSRQKRFLEPRLRGLGTIKTSVQGRLFASYAPVAPVSLSVSVAKDFGGTKGYQADIGLEAGVPLGKKLLVGASVGASYWDRKLTQGFFGVTAAQSARTGFRTFNAKSGFNAYSLGLSSIYKLTDHFNLNLILGAERRLGDSARSPVIERKWDRSAIFAVSYTF
jgi:MipA family protein